MVVFTADMPRQNRQGFLPLNYIPSDTFDMIDMPLLYSHGSEESEAGGGGGGAYGQPTTPGLQQDAYGGQATGGAEYAPQVQREHSRSSRDSRLPLDHGQDTFDFSALPTGQPIGYQQSHSAVGVYTTHGHESREPQIYYSNDTRAWNNHPLPQRGDHSRSPTTDSLVSQPGFYRRGSGRDIQGMPGSHHHLRRPPPLGTFQLHGQRHIYTDQGRSGVYPSSPSHSTGSISPVVKPESPASISVSLSSNESPRYQPLEEWLRENASIPPGQPVNLWSLPDPPLGSRPNVTYKVLVSLAIWGSPTRRLSLQEIYSQIECRFPYYKNLPDEPGRDGRGGGKKWQRSVRHNLSLESIFYNEGRDISEPGKGGYWSLTNRNGYGQKRERKRKGKSSSSQSSRESFPKIEEDDDYEEDDDDDPSHDDITSRSRSRHSRPSSSSSSSFPISPVTMNTSGAYNTFPTFGQPSNLGLSPRSRHVPSRPTSLPLLNMSDPDPGIYPSRPSTVPMFEDNNYDSIGAGNNYLHQGQGQSGYGYEHMDADESHRYLRGDKGKRRAP